jgi:hypothetical protein
MITAHSRVESEFLLPDIHQSHLMLVLEQRLERKLEGFKSIYYSKLNFLR